MTPTTLHEVFRPLASPTNLEEAIRFYAAHNMPVTPTKRGAKSGYITGWSQLGHSATPAQFKIGDNIAVLNGTQLEPEWFFYDVDIDANSNAARRIVELLLKQPTGWRYGRKSKPRSHAGYLAKGTLRSCKYVNIDGSVILELRGFTSKNTHTASVAPGSTHPSGEAILFCEPRGDVGRYEKPHDLHTEVQHAAIAIVIMTAWPKNKGSRHDLRLAFAKVLHNHRIAPKHIIAILEAVMKVTDSDEDDVEPSVNSTEAAIAAGEKTAGASAVIEVLGDDIGKKVIKAIKDILKSNVFEETPGDIFMRGGELTNIVDRTETALLAAQIYQRGGVLTRVVKLDTFLNDEGVQRKAGSTILAPVTDAWLLEQMGRVLHWFRVNKDGQTSAAEPFPIYARTLQSRGQWKFPVLRGVVNAPTLARDGRIIETPGFDLESGLLLDFAPGTFPPIPQHPTHDDARAALVKILKPLRGFPFVDGAWPVAVSALMTACVRGSLRTAPLHGFDAPVAGSGKTMLAEMVGLLATGIKPPSLSQGKTDEENEKRLSTVLACGDPVILIDNCERPVSGDSLCSMLTQETVQFRVLGFSERRVLPCTALVLATGNNLTLAGDASRRAVICRLDAQVERPDTRAFDFDPCDEVIANRPALVVAVLTILRAYHVAGRPQKLTPMGSFNDWEWIRGALVWLGCTDPADSRLAILDNDPRKDELISIIDLWVFAFGGMAVDVGEIVTTRGAAVNALQDKLIEVACRQGKWSGKAVGWWLKRHRDRVVGGRAFQLISDENARQQKWRLAGVSDELTAAAKKRIVDALPKDPGM